MWYEGMLVYCTNPLTTLWNKKFKQGSHWVFNMRGSGNYRKMGSRSFSGRRSLRRQPQSVPSFELGVVWHRILYIQKKVWLILCLPQSFILQWLYAVWHYPCKHCCWIESWAPPNHSYSPEGVSFCLRTHQDSPNIEFNSAAAICENKNSRE